MFFALDLIEFYGFGIRRAKNAMRNSRKFSGNNRDDLKKGSDTVAETIRKLSNSELEELSRILGECMTGTQLSSIFSECQVRDISAESTKWKRIYCTFAERQRLDGSSNAFFMFMKRCLQPVRFISGNNGDYNHILAEVNKPLMLMGLEITNEGKLKRIVAATTISEVERRI
jgi:hypothetical protein